MREKYIPQQIEKNGRRFGRITRRLKLTMIQTRKNIMYWKCFLILQETSIWAM